MIFLFLFSQFCSTLCRTLFFSRRPVCNFTCYMSRVRDLMIHIRNSIHMTVREGGKRATQVWDWDRRIDYRMSFYYPVLMLNLLYQIWDRNASLRTLRNSLRCPNELLNGSRWTPYEERWWNFSHNSRPGVLTKSYTVCLSYFVPCV